MLDPAYYFAYQLSPYAELFRGKLITEVVKSISEYLLRMREWNIEISIPNGVFLENPSLISIGEGTVIEPGAYIKGPVRIGKNCIIGHTAYIRENVILEEGAVVGHASEVKNSFFFQGARAPHFNYVGDSILGRNTNLGAGVKCANVRFDRKEIAATGLRKLGVILGDESQIGCNTVTNPGTYVGRGVLCLPGTVISGFIPSRNKEKQ